VEVEFKLTSGNPKDHSVGKLKKIGGKNEI